MSTKTMSKAAPAVKKSSKDQFIGKKIGANLMVTYNSEKYSRRVSKEEGEIITRKINFYNKKPSETGKKVIVKLLTPEAVKKAAEIESTKAKVKGYQKLQKKADKKAKISKAVSKDIMEELEGIIEVDKSNIAKVEAVLAKFKQIEVPQKQEATTKRGGEY